MKRINGHWAATRQGDLADVFGVSLETIRRWRKQGMPGKTKNWPLGEIAEWLRTVGPWRPNLTPESKDPLMASSDSPNLERYRGAKAGMAEMDLEDRCGVTANVEEIKAALAGFFPPFRKAVVWLGKEYGTRAQQRMEQATEQAHRGAMRAIEQFEKKGRKASEEN